MAVIWDPAAPEETAAPANGAAAEEEAERWAPEEKARARVKVPPLGKRAVAGAATAAKAAQAAKEESGTVPVAVAPRVAAGAAALISGTAQKPGLREPGRLVSALSVGMRGCENDIHHLQRRRRNQPNRCG